MILSSTIDFDVVEARQNGRRAVSRKSFVLIHLSRQIERTIICAQLNTHQMHSGTQYASVKVSLEKMFIITKTH
jgi:hypothetical protein